MAIHDPETLAPVAGPGVGILRCVIVAIHVQALLRPGLLRLPGTPTPKPVAAVPYYL